METKEIIKAFDFPEMTIINRNLPKNQIFPHISNFQDKQFLTDSISTIYMLANFKTENTRIPSYDSATESYQEIWFYYVKIKKADCSLEIFRLLSSLIPYPIVLVINELNYYTIYTGKFEKMVSGYLKLLNIYPSPKYEEKEFLGSLKDLQILNLSTQDFKIFYDSLREKLSNELAKKKYGIKKGNLSNTTLDKINELMEKKDSLSKKIKKEKQINRRIDLQMQLRYIKNELNKIMN